MPHAAARSNRSARFVSKKWKWLVTPTATGPSFVTVTAWSFASQRSSGSPCGGAASALTGSCRTISRLPSANSASTSIRRTSSATPSATSAIPSAP